MGKHLNPLEKEFLIRKYKSNPRLKMTDFCIANDISISSFPKWLKQYNGGHRLKYYIELVLILK